MELVEYYSETSRSILVYSHFEGARLVASPLGKNGANASQRQHPFSIDRDASIVFTGPRGNGKSSLAIIAGLLLRRRVIDADDHFTAKIGSSTTFKRKYGAEKYLAEQLESTKSLLTDYEKDCVIACGPSITAEQCRAFMTEYKRTHPVISVIRPADEIAAYLGLDKGKVQQWMNNIHGIYLGISTFEFFNLPETWKEATERSSAQERLESVLHHRLVTQKRVQALQKTQTALARFLTAALGHDATSLSHTVFPTLYPALPEHRVYSNVVCIPISSLVKNEVDISEIPAGADAVELVFDARNIRSRSIPASGILSRFVAEIRHFHGVPVIYHVDMALTKGPDWTSYFDLLYQGLQSAPEYLTVDLDAPESDIRLLSFKSGRTKIIAHHQNTTASADYWHSATPVEQYQNALNLGCDLVRLVKPCDTMADNFACMALVSKLTTTTTANHIPIIAYNTTSLGHLSLICNPILSPTLLHAPTSPPDPRTAPPDMTISERWSTLFLLRALDPLNFFVVGASVQKSLSPAMHNAAFHALGMPHIYSIHETTSLEDTKRLFTDPNFGGASISLPFKTGILSLVTQLSPAARLIGGSNTILPIRHLPDLHGGSSDPRDKKQRHRAGPVAMLYADNTDWMGICACVSRSISPANSVNPITAALVVGAGGMARAAVYCLMHLGVRNICIVNRTVAHAEALAAHFNDVSGDFLSEKKMDRRSHSSSSSPRERGNGQDSLRIQVLDSVGAAWPGDFAQPSIVICAIKAYDQRGSTALSFTMPKSWMENSTGGIVVELAYHSPETPLMKQMREETHLGWTVVDPVEVLFEQACSQWELFTGSRAPRKAMWQACLDDYADRMNQNDYDSM
ncbi:hypothetical protein FE257_012419 [Aspergillus nanangensis]|uniref:Quinate repressor protein n=1 Tax=Aspergillus nanangensis TaxID=2582783 RepID=A0AAD4GYV1_ASPNN|nr:hypothetical protein FE257_012419 [Aspergillus nanangensis]